MPPSQISFLAIFQVACTLHKQYCLFFNVFFFGVPGINKIAVLSCLTNALFILGISNYLFIVNSTLLVLFVSLFFLQNIHLMKTLKFVINQKQVTFNHSTLSQNLREIRRTPSSFWNIWTKLKRILSSYHLHTEITAIQFWLLRWTTSSFLYLTKVQQRTRPTRSSCQFFLKQ